MTRWRLVVHDVNQGNIATFNEGLLEWADGDYCMLLSADDAATPGALARAATSWTRTRRSAWCTAARFGSRTVRPLPRARTTVQGWSVLSGQEWLEHRFRQAENPIITPEVVVRTSLLQRVGGYDPELPKAADMELFMRLAAHADVGFIRGADQALYRRHETNMSMIRDGVDGPAPAAVGLRGRAGALRRQAGEHGPDVRRGAPTAGSRGPLGGGAGLRPGSAEGVRAWVDDSWVGARTRASRTSTSCWRSPPTAGPTSAGTRLYRALEGAETSGPSRTPVPAEPEGQWWLRRRSWRYRGY